MLHSRHLLTSSSALWSKHIFNLVYLHQKSSQWKSTIDTRRKSPITFFKSVHEGFSEIQCPNYHYTMVKTPIQPCVFARKEFSMEINHWYQEKIGHHVFEISWQGVFRDTIPQLPCQAFLRVCFISWLFPNLNWKMLVNILHFSGILFPKLCVTPWHCCSSSKFQSNLQATKEIYRSREWVNISFSDPRKPQPELLHSLRNLRPKHHFFACLIGRFKPW